MDHARTDATDPLAMGRSTVPAAAGRRRKGKKTTHDDALQDDGETGLSSSFADVPAAVLTGPSATLLGRTGGRWLLGQLRGTGGDSGGGVDLLQLAVLGPAKRGGGGGRGLAVSIWTVLRTSVFRGGTRSAVPYLLAAALLHNARRVLWPALGGCCLLAESSSPVEDVRLVLARPDLLVDASLAAVAVAPRLLACAARKCVWHAVGGGLCAFVVTRPARRTLARRAQDVAAVVFLLWLFSCIEYAVARSVHAGALAYACGVLLRRDASLSLLGRMAAEHGLLSSLVLTASQLVTYPLLGLLPLCAAAARGACRRRFGLLLALLSVGAYLYVLQRYRTRLFLAIEAGGFFVVLAFVGISGLLMLANARSSQRARQRARQKND